MEHTVEAYNTATASTNKIHDDDVARSYGFGGGLVPGVDVYAYLTHLPARLWGAEWLAAGSISARFGRPVYDGELVTIATADTADTADDVLSLELRGPDGEVRATATAHRTATPDHSAAVAPDPLCVREQDRRWSSSLTQRSRGVPGHRRLPDERPQAGADSLAPGTTLGTVEQTFDAAAAARYLVDVREVLPLYAAHRIAHPGWLLRCANTVLAANVVLGPWIHVSSEVRFHGVVLDGERIETRAVVLDEFERSGHRFVTLDVAVLGDDRALRQRVRHTAIHAPRRR